METKLVKISCEAPEAALVEEAGRILREGGLVAFPTETVYGLGGNGLDPKACKEIYRAKGRPSDNPLILHISQIDELRDIVREITPMAQQLIDAFWPGPLTMIFNKAEKVPMAATGGLSTVAVRFPSHPVARAIIGAAGVPIAAPSANSSGKPSPTRASHVEFDLGGSIAMIVDGGATQWGLESTIVDVSSMVPVLLRPGAVSKEMLEAVVGLVDLDWGVMEKPTEDVVPQAPGMKYTHYSPDAQVVLVQGGEALVVAKINDLTALEQAKGKKVGVMATEQTKALYQADVVLSLGQREDLAEIGANLFKLLRKFDYLGVDRVFAEVFPQTGEGLAIMNRLQKAAAYEMIEAGKKEE